MSVCLIECVDGQYRVTEHGAEFLRELTEPMATIGCIGVYRSGKSALLSLLLQGKVFKTSSSVNAQTRGIWLSRKTMTTEGGRPMLIIDSEGGGATNANVAHDTNILALTVLLSSMVLVNTVGAISKSSLAQLRMVARVSQLLTSHAGFQGDMRPALQYILRDFSLETVDDEGKQLTEDEYLEHALRKDPDLYKQISDLFPTRRCTTMPRPCTRDSDLASMENMRPEFVAKVDRLRTTLQTKAPLKKVGGKPLSGPQLLALATAVCDGINTGQAVPDLKDVWDHVAHAHALQTMHQTAARYREQLAGLGVLEHWETAAVVFRPLEVFDSQLLESSEEARAEAISEFQRIYVAAQKENQRECTGKLEAALAAFAEEAQGIVDLAQIQELSKRFRPMGLESAFSTRVLPKIFEVIQASRHEIEHSLHSTMLSLTAAEEKQQRLQDELSESEATVASLRSKVKQASQEDHSSQSAANATLVEKHRAVSEELAMAVAERERLGSELSTVTQECQYVTEHNKELEKCLEESTEKVMILRMENKEQDGLVKRKARLVADLEVQIKTMSHSLQDDLQALKKRTVTAEADATLAQEKLAAVKKIHEQRGEQLEEQERANVELVTQIKGLRSDAQVSEAAHQGELIRLKTELKVMQNRLESGERAAKRQRTSASSVELHVELKLLRKRAAEHSQEVEHLRQQIEDEAKARRQAELSLLQANLT